jgi:hypothetical protein
MSDIKEMQEATTAMAESLGVVFDPVPYEELSQYRKGEPLLIEELDALPDGSPVWGEYRPWGAPAAEFRGAFRASRQEDEGYWLLACSPSFGEDFTHTAGPGKACWDDSCGEGRMQLFHAVRKG